MNLNNYKIINTDLDFLLTTKCDENCIYCDFPTIQNTKSVTLNDLDKINYYFDFCTEYIKEHNINKKVGFIGGEIGLLEKDIINYIFNLIRKSSLIHYINTNGMLYYNYPKCIDIENLYIDWHITDNAINNNFVPKINKNIGYTIIITNENYNNTLKYYNKYKDTVKIKLHNCYSIRNNYEQCNIIKNKKIFNKKNCNKNSNFFSLDFTNYTIHKCCKSYTQFETKELNKQNLIKAFNGELFNISELCNNCEWNF